jgi:hypothetical protein
MRPNRASRAVVVLLVGVVACDSESGFPDARIPDASPVPGTVSLSWTITDTNDSSTIACDEANANTVTITVREQGATTGSADPFTCSSGQGTSRPFLPGTYMVGFELRGTDGQIATAPSVSDIVIASGVS